MNVPKFDVTVVKSTFLATRGQSSLAMETLAVSNGFTSEANTFALIGLGGTISSAYSPTHETIKPKNYLVASTIVTNIQNKFGILGGAFSGIDLFAKDSRDVTNDDLLLLLHFVDYVKCKNILITCGTYMLPRIALLLGDVFGATDKIIGVTGAMLPAGFMGSDAELNVLSTLSVINDRSRQNRYGVFAVFHGNIYDGTTELKSMDLHPSSHTDILIGYPQTYIPVDRE